MELIWLGGFFVGVGVGLVLRPAVERVIRALVA